MGENTSTNVERLGGMCLGFKGLRPGRYSRSDQEGKFLPMQTSRLYVGIKGEYHRRGSGASSLRHIERR